MQWLFGNGFGGGLGGLGGFGRAQVSPQIEQDQNYTSDQIYISPISFKNVPSW